MKDSAYLVVNARGIKAIIRKNRPKLNRGEYAIFIRLSVPDHVFVERPMADVTLDVKAEQMIAPPVLVEQIDPEDTSRAAASSLSDDPDYKAGREG